MSNTEFAVEALPIEGAFLIQPATFGDHRGYFSVAHDRTQLVKHGIDADFYQDNQSFSAACHTLRGLHCQMPPYQQAKLVRVLQGRATDVIVDARRGSPTFGAHHKQDLSADNRLQVFIPRGCLHGFITREPDTIVMYKVDNEYSLGNDRSIMWNDPELGIDWELDGAEPVVSQKDATALSWEAFDAPFRFPER